MKKNNLLRMWVHVNYLLLMYCSVMAISVQLVAQTMINRRLPDEIESVGGEAHATAFSGVAVHNDASAVRLNPALLAVNKTYDVTANYHWPAEGREFYQVGIIDSRTAAVSAGILYTSFLNEPELKDSADSNDLHVYRRFHLGIAKELSTVALGIGANYLEARIYDEGLQPSKTSGTTINAGIVGRLTPTITVGASIENLANKKIKNFAPQIIRAGIGALFFNNLLRIHLDYRQRERIPQLELSGLSKSSSEGSSSYTLAQELELDEKYQEPERMVFTGASIRLYDYWQISSGYGANLGGASRQTMAAGIGNIGPNRLTYMVSRPYLSRSELHHEVAATLTIKW